MIVKTKKLLFFRSKTYLPAFLLLLFLLAIFSSGTEAAGDKIQMDVKSMMLKSGNIPVIVILKDQPSFKSLSKENAVSSLKSHASGSQQKLAALLDEEKSRGKAEKIKQFWIVNAIAVNASPELIERLAKRDDVASIELDAELHIMEDFSVQVSQGQIDSATSEIKRINATKVWELGIDGTGINVSVIDTGINASHPDIAGRVIKWVDYIGGLSSPYDDHGHGTHVAGTVGGNGSRGNTTGVAPNVSLLVAKVCNSAGTCPSSSIVSGIQWSVENKANITSISLGGSSRDTAITTAVTNAMNAGVVVIAAAGNSGPGEGTINYPAGEKNVIAVGAVDSSDNIANFSGCGGCSSSRGPITVDGEVLTKPDVSAPGKDITSLYYLSNGYAIMSGTSMATPHVSGAVALMLQAARNNGSTLTPAQIKNILETTSVDLGTSGKDNTYGAGRIDVFAAIAPTVVANPTEYLAGNSAARNDTTITLNATITDAIAGVKNATVNVSAINASLTNVSLTNASGFWRNSSIIVNASDGIYKLNVTAYNNLGLANNFVQLSVTVDNTKPHFFNASATPSTIEAGSEISVLRANITDNTSGVARVIVNLSSINGSSSADMQNNSGIWQLSVNTTAFGNFTLDINATDGAGNFENMNVLLNTTDTRAPVITSAYASPDSIRANGVDNTTLSVNTHDFANVSSIRNVTVNLTQINGSSAQELNNNSGVWQLLNVNTSIAGKNGTLIRLPLNVTDSRNNSNTSASVLLGIKVQVNTSAGNQILFNFTIDSTIFNASITIPESTDVSGELLIAPVDVPSTGDLKHSGVALNLSNLSFNMSLRIEIEYNATYFNDTQNQSKRRLWFYNTTTGTWNLTENSSVDVASRTVSGDAAHFSVFAPLADTTAPVISGVSASSITTGSATITWTTNEASKSLVKYGTASGSYTSTKEDTSNVTSHTLQLTGLSASTTYYYVVNSTDQSGNSAESVENSFTTSSSGGSTSSSGGGGGGGGGGASGENASNILVKEKYDLHIFKDLVTAYRFTNGSNPVKFVNITGNVSAGEINVAVEVLRGTSTLVNISPPGNVYKNINIWAGSSGFATPRNIKKATVDFGVDKNWIKENSIKSIKLLRYDAKNKEWVTLPTNKVGENVTENYYQGETDRFSSFAIAGEKSPVSTIVSQAKAISATATAKETPVASESPLIYKDSSSEKTPNWTLTLILFVIVVALSAVYIFKLKRR